MRKSITLIATLATAAFLTVGAQADLLYVNLTQNSGNGFSSQNDTSGGNGNYATVFAGFNVAAGSTINQYNWIGEFFNPAQHANITGFTLNTYSDNAGTVGALVDSQHFGGNSAESFIGTFNGFDNYIYQQAVNPFAFSGNGWVSIVADLGFPPQWGLVDGQNATPLGYQDFFGTRSQLGSSIALAVFGTPAAVPEPASMAALGLGIAALIRRRKASK